MQIDMQSDNLCIRECRTGMDICTTFFCSLASVRFHKSMKDKADNKQQTLDEFPELRGIKKNIVLYG